MVVKTDEKQPAVNRNVTLTRTLTEGDKLTIEGPIQQNVITDEDDIGKDAVDTLKYDDDNNIQRTNTTQCEDVVVHHYPSPKGYIDRDSASMSECELSTNDTKEKIITVEGGDEVDL